MDLKNALSLTEARKQIFQLARQVQKPDTHYVLTDKGQPKVVLMSVEEFEAWQETLETLLDFPDLEQDLEAAEQDLKAGNYVALDELAEEEA